MTLLDNAVEMKKFDSRVVERHLDRGIIKSSEYQKFVDSLPDDAANAERIDVDDLAKQDPIPKKLPKNPEGTSAEVGSRWDTSL